MSADRLITGAGGQMPGPDTVTAEGAQSSLAEAFKSCSVAITSRLSSGDGAH